ncbi:hypothetical protein HLH34_13660 [Gluconacetobacter azotocaptans]|uniref:Uncharacterized protein n=1 Tax=Gluconacetobacter azotocaptans TaxID=142834 RepID=A0A7W4PFX0_9PROT|nr:hypothetical protein [Gluconacetobacter azotocaptans]
MPLAGGGFFCPRDRLDRKVGESSAFCFAVKITQGRRNLPRLFDTPAA